MALQEDIRAKLIKQFATDVISMKDKDGMEYYACPTCKHQIAMSNDKCPSCDQVLKWDNIRQMEIKKSGKKTATLTFEVPGDFEKSDCRKCPISFIGKSDGESVYGCPLGMRNSCPLELSN